MVTRILGLWPIKNYLDYLVIYLVILLKSGMNKGFLQLSKLWYSIFFNLCFQNVVMAMEYCMIGKNIGDFDFYWKKKNL